MMWKCTIAYDGTQYFGWQKNESGPSIQGMLESAVERIAQEKAPIEAASRTDRGVHAEGQVVAFSLTKQWEPRSLQRALNAVLPRDIRVLQCERVIPSFHPTLDAQYKQYRYRVSLGDVQDPQWRNFAWHYRTPLHCDLMEAAIDALTGTRDFQGFSNGKRKNSLCTLSHISITRVAHAPSCLTIDLVGNRFLYKMVRNLVGQILFVGSKKLPLDSIAALLATKEKQYAAMTAPAHGLFLHRVLYPPLDDFRNIGYGNVGYE